MSGKTETLITALICALSVAGAATDLARGKVYNALTLPAIALGLVARGATQGVPGLLDSAGGIGLGFLLLGWMFFVRAMGAGDVKFLMALGAWGGVAFSLETGLLSVLLGGLLAAGVLLSQGKLLPLLKRIVLLPYTRVSPIADRSQTIPYAVPIGIAAVWTILAHPLRVFLGGA